jgi:predicted alpha/beta hydrolase family esterase
MVKTNAPSRVTIAGKKFDTNALPDQFDENDLVYRPKLQVLPTSVDRRAGQPISDQLGQSCTGQAVAALINTVLSTPFAKEPAHGAPRKPPPEPVSPYMLYAMARRYDEYPGDADIGSSLRGAFKGWYYHGVCRLPTWNHNDKAEKRNFEDPAFLDECWQTPLGAYYRVNSRRIDDMQSAITELNAIAASAAIHAGWIEPEVETGGRKPNHVIKRFGDQIGGHAFLIAGYNDRGFLVQNSWGTKWGDRGYATLPYEDWLYNGYDAWVARPGVPQVGNSQRRRVVVPAGRTLVTGTGPNVGRLKSFVIDVTKGGRLSDKGKVSSSPTQLKGLAADMETKHDEWAKQELAANPNARPKRRLVFYAHGGLVGEAGGIAVADRMINWWLQNHIYPVHIVWESDALTTIFSFLDHIKEVLPFGGLLDGFWEALDRRIEGGGRKIQQLWEEMKHNAELASAPLTAGRPAVDEPGVTQFITLLKSYRARRPEVEVHLVGHSAGSVVLAAVVERLMAEGIPVESMQLMGGAIPVDEFMDKVAPSIQAPPNQPGVRRFTAYDLTDDAELDDTCPSPPIVIYHKSLLYFVSRALEPAPAEFEKPMVGLSKFVPQLYTMKDGSRKRLIDVIGGPSNLVIAPTNEPNAPVDSLSKAKGHADFDDDPDTMTSVVLRIMQTRDITTVKPYPRGGMPTG